MRRFWTKKWVKNGSRKYFAKFILERLGCSNKCFYPNLSPWLHIWPTENPIILKVGHPWTQKDEKGVKKVVLQKLIWTIWDADTNFSYPSFSPW